MPMRKMDCMSRLVCARRPGAVDRSDLEGEVVDGSGKREAGSGLLIRHCALPPTGTFQE